MEVRSIMPETEDKIVNIDEEETNKSLGKRIKTEREERGLSQRELSNLTDISHVTISRIEKGETSPRDMQIRKIANALGVPRSLLDPDPRENRVDRELKGLIQEFGIKGILFRDGKQIEDLSIQEKKNFRDALKKIGKRSSNKTELKNDEP